jgi:hypothetical protein
MSGSGQKQTFRSASGMSVWPPKADIERDVTISLVVKSAGLDSAFSRWDFFRKKLNRIRILILEAVHRGGVSKFVTLNGIRNHS